MIMIHKAACKNVYMIAAFFILSLPVISVYGADYPGEVSEWQACARHVFEVDGLSCTLVVPKTPAAGLPWVLYANPLEEDAEIAVMLLGRGFHVAYVDVAGLYGNSQAVAGWDAFYAWARDTLQLAEKPVLAGTAQGSILVYNWAAANPDKAGCIYMEFPWLQVDPALAADDAARELIAAALSANGSEGKPITLVAQADAVGKATVPVMHIYGEKKPGTVPDKSVEQFYAAYRLAGKGDFQSITRPSSNDDDKVDLTIAPLIFILKHTEQLTGAPMDTPIAGMEQWKVADFSGRANVFVLDDVLVIEEGNEMTGVVCAEEPILMNYEIMLDAMRLAGGDFFCGLTAPYEDTNFSLVVGGWGGTCVGISSLDWLDAYHNETAVFRSFESHRWYRIRLRVTPGNIKAWIDGKETVNVDVDKREVDIRWEMSPTVPLGIATWCTTGAVRNFSVRALE